MNYNIVHQEAIIVLPINYIIVVKINNIVHENIFYSFIVFIVFTK
jgi:hypothetical protein